MVADPVNLPTDRSDPFWSELPDWLEGFRPNQIELAADIVDKFSKSNLVILDAPTGTGKTLIAEMVRVAMRARALYVCTTKSLQQQFAKDFQCAVLMGRANYPTMTEGVTADDCRGDACLWCEDRQLCPYVVARREFYAHRLAVTNTAYAITQLQSPTGKITNNRSLIIVDEADELESTLVGAAELYVSRARAEQFGMGELVKGAHTPTVLAWLDECSRRMLAWSLDNKITPSTPTREARKIRAVRELRSKIVNVSRDLALNPETWVRDYGSDRAAVQLKPVVVGAFGRTRLWAHTDKVLAMSATIINPEQWVQDVGWEWEGEQEWGLVCASMTFPKDRRPILFCPVADMARKREVESKEQALRRMAEAVEVLINSDTERRVLGQKLDMGCGGWQNQQNPLPTLLHCVSYELGRELFARLTGKHPKPNGLATTTTRQGVPVVFYASADARDDAIAEFTKRGGLLIGSSLERGLDLAGDLCRRVIIAKVPYPNLGDRRTAARARLADGNSWYATHTARTIVQMTGRGMRSADDWCTSWILDAHFDRFWSKHRNLLPAWWRNAVEKINPRQLTKEENNNARIRP